MGTRGAWGRAGNEADLCPPPSLPGRLGWPHPSPQLSMPALCYPLATQPPGELKENNSDHVPPLFTTFQRLPTALRVNSELSTGPCWPGACLLLQSHLGPPPHTLLPNSGPLATQTPQVLRGSRRLCLKLFTPASPPWPCSCEFLPALWLAVTPSDSVLLPPDVFPHTLDDLLGYCLSPTRT